MALIYLIEKANEIAGIFDRMRIIRAVFRGLMDKIGMEFLIAVKVGIQGVRRSPKLHTLSMKTAFSMAESESAVSANPIWVAPEEL